MSLASVGLVTWTPFGASFIHRSLICRSSSALVKPLLSAWQMNLSISPFSFAGSPETTTAPVPVVSHSRSGTGKQSVFDVRFVSSARDDPFFERVGFFVNQKSESELRLCSLLRKRNSRQDAGTGNQQSLHDEKCTAIGS